MSYKANSIDGDIKINKVSSENNVVGLEFVETGDDKGLALTGGQFSVGTKDEPNETILGSGDSTPVEIAFHCDISDTTGLTIVNATDITTILESDNGSSTGFFGGTTTGKYVLVGSDYPFGGNKLKWDTAGSVNPENVLVEYLRDSVPTWITAAFMVTDSAFPYTQKGYNFGTVSNASEQIFYGFDPDDLPTTWNMVTLNINGVEYTKYWGRFRIISPIVTDPIIEQVKMHSNSFEIEGDGTTSYRGRARYKKTLVFGMESITPNTAFAPANENVQYGTNLTAGYQYNRFNNNTTDGFAIIQNIVEGLDTSVPLEIAVAFYVDGTQTGNVELQAEVFQVSDGFIYNGTNIPEEYSIIKNVPISADLTRQTAKFKVLVNKLSPPDAIIVNIFRDATNGNPDDTVQQAIVITNVALAGYFWRP